MVSQDEIEEEFTKLDVSNVSKINTKGRKVIGAHIREKNINITEIRSYLSEINADCGQILFENNVIQMSCPNLAKNHIREFVDQKNNVIAHGNFRVNLANVKEKTLKVLNDELKKTSLMGIKLYVLHPGFNVRKKDQQKVLKEIASHLNKAIEENPNVTICLETMAGQGTSICSTLEEISGIIKHIKNKKRIGVCLDTCHVFAAGYPIHEKCGYEIFMADFERIIGFEYLKVIHLNDSMTQFGKKIDRHECIGEGYIGIDLFKWIVSDERFDVPMILETPKPEKYKKEIELLRSFINKKGSIGDETKENQEI